MLRSLYPLFQAIATAPTEQELRLRFMDSISDYFEVQRWGIYLLNPDNGFDSVDTNGVSDTFIEQYQKFGKSIDPVLRYVVQYHAPAHEELVLPDGTWKQSELYQRCCSTYDHEHIMTGPIVGQGQLIGTVNFARIGHVPAFNQLDLASLGAVCTHFSARLAELRKQSFVPNPMIDRLTSREIQIANLAAKGLTNAEIGAELWITQNSVKQALKRMFRKLEVSARTEMVAKLRDTL
ncbi:GAF domain-containing protein [Pseudanabaena sp. UWO311]|uniref:LuxR C-terminal-related transcriptional regulator n=1 Tax=Pseudanabaena sp. UWO311 TaxID=2487337 RepID=UPI001157DAA1|nr:LuxR C-terminal-related transcriptional regulator [Pseudanabaena sp. UWO311]TYQ27787.1 GAF domain-containing protein [Pseudanabaena sp. UWO311]